MREPMLLTAPALALLLAGCTATAAPQPPRTPSPAVTPVAATPLVAPAVTSAELGRSTIDGDLGVDGGGSLRGVRTIHLDVECRGAAGSTVRFALTDPRGAGFGPSGVTRCGGDGDHVGARLAGVVPSRVQVVLTPAGRVTTAYAILSGDA